MDLPLVQRLMSSAVRSRQQDLIEGRDLPRTVRHKVEARTHFPHYRSCARSKTRKMGSSSVCFAPRWAGRRDGSDPVETIPLLHLCLEPGWVRAALRFLRDGPNGVGEQPRSPGNGGTGTCNRKGADRPRYRRRVHGEGEPFPNYEEVIRACKVLSHAAGAEIQGAAITISRAGITPTIRRFTQEGHTYRPAVSLHAATSEKRVMRIRHESKWPLPDLMDAVLEYQQASGDPIMLEWTMISGWNCSRQDAEQIGELVGDLPVRFNIIDVNNASGRDQKPSPEELVRFLNALDAHLAQPVGRYSGGKSIEAACGMLAGSE